jgi:hypothetical protein
MRLIFASVICLGLVVPSRAQTGWDVAIGGQQYFAPIKNANVGHWQPNVIVGPTVFLTSEAQ